MSNKSFIIHTKTGSATSPQPSCSEHGSIENGVIVAHIVNNERKWGKGFVLAINDVSLAPREAYKAWEKLELGTTQFVEAKPNFWVANMVAQNGVNSLGEIKCRVDYSSLEDCLELTFRRAILLGCDVHIPSGIGSGLAGGDKSRIHSIIHRIAKYVTEQMPDPVPCQLCRSTTLNITLWEFEDQSAKSFVPNA